MALSTSNHLINNLTINIIAILQNNEYTLFFIRNDKRPTSTRSFLIFTTFLVPKISIFAGLHWKGGKNQASAKVVLQDLATMLEVQNKTTQR